MQKSTPSIFTLYRPIPKGDKKIIRGWIMFDWSNSAYQLTILSAIFPVYYNTITRQHGSDIISIFGFNIINTVAYSWSIAISYFTIALLSPFMSAVADYTGRRKLFMKIFTFIGVISCTLLFYFTPQTITLGLICFTLATTGYCGSLVFYNSFLPVIAEPNEQDLISAKGYSMGYIGAVILLLINLFIISFPHLFYLTNNSLPARIAFVSVGLWWFGFSQITFSRLPKYTFGLRDKNKNPLIKGYSELHQIARNVFKSTCLKIYLIAFFFFTMGTLTVMFMAAVYGEKQLRLTASTLIPIILGIQLLGAIGAYLFAILSKKIRNVPTLIISVLCWLIICTGAYFIQTVLHFILVAIGVGLIMGGSQSLARSTYSKMIPADTQNHTSYFSFYDVMEKLATVGGTFSFGIIESITGNMRYSVLAIISFFIISLIFLFKLLFLKQPDINVN